MRLIGYLPVCTPQFRFRPNGHEPLLAASRACPWAVSDLQPQHAWCHPSLRKADQTPGTLLRRRWHRPSRRFFALFRQAVQNHAKYGFNNGPVNNTLPACFLTSKNRVQRYYAGGIPPFHRHIVVHRASRTSSHPHKNPLSKHIAHTLPNDSCKAAFIIANCAFSFSTLDGLANDSRAASSAFFKRRARRVQ